MKRLTIAVPDFIYTAVVERQPWAVKLVEKLEDYAKRLGTFYELVQKTTTAPPVKEDDYGAEDHGAN